MNDGHGFILFLAQRLLNSESGLIEMYRDEEKQNANGARKKVLEYYLCSRAPHTPSKLHSFLAPPLWPSTGSSISQARSIYIILFKVWERKSEADGGGEFYVSLDRVKFSNPCIAHISHIVYLTPAGQFISEFAKWTTFIHSLNFFIIIW